MAQRSSPQSRLGPYVIERELGRGGMAVVYEAVHAELGRRVAIKVLGEGVSASPDALARFRREAKLLAKLHHPHIVAATDLDAHEGRAYFVMELLLGPTLAAHLHGGAGHLPLGEIVELFLPITAAVAAAHAGGVIHRDLKPSNVILARRGYRFHPTVVDFGISRSGGEDDQALTRTGAVMGTVAYLSPEQTRGAGFATARSDQYAIGVMLYECATGKIPFRKGSAYETMHAIVTEGLDPPSRVRGELPAAFDALVARAMERDPARRFPTVTDLGRALLALGDDRVRALWGDELQEATLPPEEARTTAPASEPTDEAPTEEPVARDGSGALTPPASAGGAAHPAPRVRRANRWLAGLVAAGLALGGAGVIARAPKAQPRATPPPDPVKAAVAALAGPDARLACPIFEVRGVRDIGVRLGAAAATLACARARWDLGGSDDRVLVPAALLDVPRQPVEGLADPYLAPEQRARTIALARERAAAYVDGVVTYGRDFEVEIVLRTPDDREIERAEGRDPAFLPAMKKALDAAWRAPLVGRPLDPDVARWTSLPDAELGVVRTNTELFDTTDGCAGVGPRAGELGNAFFLLRDFCASSGFETAVDAGVPALDESSPSALVTSVEAISVGDIPVPSGEARRVATALETFRDAETSGFGRAQMSLAAAELWSIAGAAEQGHEALLVGLREDPLLIEAWHALVTLAGRTGSAGSASRVASDWFPEESRFLSQARSFRGDELEERLRDAKLAYTVEPGLQNALSFGRALAEAGRSDEVRALAATPGDSPEAHRTLESYLLAFLDLHDAKLGRALTRLEEAGDVAMVHLVVVADVVGRADEVAARWTARFLSLPDAKASLTARAFDAPMILCMRAPRDLATRCLDRIARLGHANVNWWGEGGEALLEGARRYATGDVARAVAAWRPLVAGSSDEIVRLLPTEAFERAGEANLAARLDALKMPFTMIAGVSDAAPREATRALAAGHANLARSLAQQVVRGWEVADVAVPAVGRMRALLQKISPSVAAPSPTSRHPF